MPRILLSFPPFLPASQRRGFLADLAEKVRLGEYVMHSAEELEFRGFLERGQE